MIHYPQQKFIGKKISFIVKIKIYLKHFRMHTVLIVKLKWLLNLKSFYEAAKNFQAGY
jgi:hypothetical protein